MLKLREEERQLGLKQRKIKKQSEVRRIHNLMLTEKEVRKHSEERQEQE